MGSASAYLRVLRVFVVEIWDADDGPIPTEFAIRAENFWSFTYAAG